MRVKSNVKAGDCQTKGTQNLVVLVGGSGAHGY